MQQLTPLEYLKIDIANNWGAGLDRESWQTRIDFTDQHEPVLDSMHVSAESPFLFAKAVNAYREVQAGNPTGHIMGLDATASGPQIMAVLSGCISSATATNVIDSGKREDIYEYIANEMVTEFPGVTRSDLKGPVMVYFYGGVSGAIKQFGKQGAARFFNILEQTLPGPTQLMKLFLGSWRPDVTHHQWYMPDGHKVYVPVVEVQKKGVEIDEADHFRLTYQTSVLSKSPSGLSLAANIVHSIDGYICRQLVRRANAQGFSVAPIHDCFFASPKHMQRVREIYRDLLIEIHEMDLVSDILTQISGEKFVYKQMNNFSAEIKKAEYVLS